jgi:hypothetical protein
VPSPAAGPCDAPAHRIPLIQSFPISINVVLGDKLNSRSIVPLCPSLSPCPHSADSSLTLHSPQRILSASCVCVRFDAAPPLPLTHFKEPARPEHEQPASSRAGIPLRHCLAPHTHPLVSATLAARFRRLGCSSNKEVTQICVLCPCLTVSCTALV